MTSQQSISSVVRTILTTTPTISTSDALRQVRAVLGRTASNIQIQRAIHNIRSQMKRGVGPRRQTVAASLPAKPTFTAGPSTPLKSLVALRSTCDKYAMKPSDLKELIVAVRAAGSEEAQDEVVETLVALS